MMRLVQRAPQAKGLVIGWLIGRQVDPALCKALPGFAIVVTDQAPLSVTSADIQGARKLAGAAVDLPITLVGFSAGCQSVRCVVHANLIKGPIACVAVFDGTHSEVEATETSWKIQVWAQLADRARAGELTFIATCSNMSYTKHIAVGQPGRAKPTREVLELALGVTLEPGAKRFEGGPPVVDGLLYAQCFQSESIDKDAHMHQENDVLPDLLDHLINGFPHLEFEDAPATPRNDLPEVPMWRDPKLTFRERCLAWSLNEMHLGICEVPDGSNSGPRIRDYFEVPAFQRDGKPIHLTSGKWCAASACMAEHEAFIEGVDDFQLPVARVAGIELETDAKNQGKFYTGEPEIGDLAIFKQLGAGGWERHVTRVLEKGLETFTTIAGNEHNKWGEVQRAYSDANLVGFITRP